MPQSPFSRFQETVSASVESRRERANAVRRTRSEMAETIAVTRKTIIESQELMAEVDDVIARRWPTRVGTTRLSLKGGVMEEHKFRAGQRVRLAPNGTTRHAGGGGYMVTKQ